MNEAIIERDIDRAVAASRKADCNLWIAGFFAARVVGMYQNSGTIEIALRAGKSPSSVENWAHAWQMYDELRSFGDVSELRELRKRFTPSHFWTMWDLKNKYGYGTKKAIHYFNQLTDYKENGLPHSVETLRQEVAAEEEQDGNTPTWEYYAPRLGKFIVRVMAASGLPNSVIRWLKSAPPEISL